MTPSQLKAHVDARGSKFFIPRNMRWSGDTMKNYGVRSVTFLILETGREEECWELYRKQPTRYGLADPAYFRKDTFELVHVADK